MYLEYWGLERSPFAEGREPPLFYEGDAQVEALARLRFVARHGRPAALLAGARGAGKSTVLRRFIDHCRREGREVAAIRAAGLSVRELLWQISGPLRVGPRAGDDAPRLFRRLADYAAAARWRRRGAVVILDDVDQSGPDAYTHLVRLLGLGGDRSWITLVLASTPRGVMRLGEELLDAIDLRIDLEPWSESETTGYVQHALIEAGGERPAFDDEALSALYHLTDGVPRRVNRLADHALLGAAAEGLSTVNAATIEAAHDALNWTSPA
jgi:general secretion pathway protein A